MASYTASFRVDHFLGLYQDGDGIGKDPRYALEAVNVETEGGVLSCVAKGQYLQAEMNRPIATLMRLHRRWHVAEQERDVLVAASDGKLFWMLPKDEAWKEIQMPGGLSRYQSDDWSWVTYEINPEGSNAPVDVLLLSNAKDGMICVRGDDMSASSVNTPKKFGVITRYAERIWGGAILDDPDMLVYSAPMNPFDWEQNNDIPADGAGDVMQPSWDGDSFVALTQFGSQLIALKRQRVWRILGTDPGMYAFKEQYGGGALVSRTLSVDGERIWMLGAEGLMVYDGLSVMPFANGYAKKVFERVNPASRDLACACTYQNRYYCALPLDGGVHNNAVLIYNTREQTWLLREGITVEAFLPCENGLFYTSATEPGRIWQWGENPMKTGAVSPARWVSHWFDLDAKNTWKTGFTVYLAFEIEAPQKIRVKIHTERKTRTKTLFVRKSGKPYKMVFGGGGKRFQLEIESCGAFAWRLIGGIQMEIGLDPE